MQLHDNDKKGEALKAQRFQMLEDIASELSGDIVFPTYFDAVMRLRKLLQDPNQTLDGIASGIALEPLISAKLLHMANAAAMQSGGGEIVDLKSALSRLGVDRVRSTALAIAVSQLMRSKGMAAFSDLAHTLWEHSIQTAAAARVLARKLTRINPETAMLAGLVHDLGAFYMLYRATQYHELCERPESVKYLIVQWHESIGVSLLDAIGLPQEIVEATVDHDHMRPLPAPPKSLGDLVYIANMLAGGHFEWVLQDQPARDEDIAVLSQIFAEFLPEIAEETSEMRASFA